MGYDITYAAAGADTDKSWYHEAVIQDVLAFARSTGTVKTDAGQIAGVGGQDKVAVAHGHKGQQQLGLKTKAEAKGNNRRQCGCLAVHKLGDKHKHQSVRPGISRHHACQFPLDETKVGMEKAVSHPGHAKNGKDGDHPSLEDGAT